METCALQKKTGVFGSCFLAPVIRLYLVHGLTVVHLAWRSAINQAIHTSLPQQEAVGFLGSISIGLCWEDKHFQTIKAVRATRYILPCLSSLAFQFVFFFWGGAIGEWVGVKRWLPHYLIFLSQSWCNCMLAHRFQMPAHGHFQAQGRFHKLRSHPKLRTLFLRILSVCLMDLRTYPQSNRWHSLDMQDSK